MSERETYTNPNICITPHNDHVQTQTRTEIFQRVFRLQYNKTSCHSDSVKNEKRNNFF